MSRPGHDPDSGPDTGTDPVGINARKHDHIRAFALDPGIERNASGFDAIRLTHRALPELDRAGIDPSVGFLGKRLSFPLIISSMTGGAGDDIARINRNLAEAAEACGVAMAVGSQRVMLADPAARASFDLRPFAPNAVLVSNVGAVQLNYGFGADECRALIELLDADGLYLHLNPLQEVVQPDGDTDFSDLAAKLAALVPQIPVPVLLKEVGAGLSGPDIAAGLAAGIRHFDVAGRGGTSWSRVEYLRRREESDDLGLLFQDWGLTTVEALAAARRVLATALRDAEPAVLIASGGIRNGIDMAKAMILGADLCGIAAPLLAAAQESRQAVIARIEHLRREFETALFLLGCADCDALRGNEELIL